MGAAKWLAYILSFFVPIFGFVSFWVFTGRGEEIDGVGKRCLIASFIGLVVFIVLAAVGISMGVALLKPIWENVWPF